MSPGNDGVAGLGAGLGMRDIGRRLVWSGWFMKFRVNTVIVTDLLSKLLINCSYVVLRGWLWIVNAKCMNWTM